MKKIVIPITNDNVIEDHFGRCKFYEVYIFSETNEIIDLKLLESDGKCGCKSNIIDVLVKEGVTNMLAGNIGDNAKKTLNAAGISVIRGCSGKSADVILQFIDGKIVDTEISCLQLDKQHQNKEHVCYH
ncbi:MAG: NifB/NifX family molybdenum-iron cluster-binding protein [Polaribacter sp.]|uniref:NifB/NifX family molybdenum-iron cluster-binding protein n=1 Tax=Polaribacter sp. TaxID=1920175 RepID=UPI003266C2DD